MECSYDFDYLNKYYENFSNVTINAGTFNMDLGEYMVEIKPDGEFVGFKIEKKAE